VPSGATSAIWRAISGWILTDSALEPFGQDVASPALKDPRAYTFRKAFDAEACIGDAGRIRRGIQYQDERLFLIDSVVEVPGPLPDN